SGGFCLPKDSAYLAPWTHLGNELIKINDYLFPTVLANEICKRLRDGKTVGVLGVNAMRDVDDFRGSLGEKLFSYVGNAEIPWHDPFDDRMCDDVALRKVMECDVIVIGIPHSAYKNLDFTGKEVINSWGSIT